MIKQAFLLFVVFGISTFSYCQITNYSSYLIKVKSISKITELELLIDSTGQTTESITRYQMLFNDKGDLIEKRESFANDSKYISTTFEYDNLHNITNSSYNNPYGFIDEVWLTPPISKCETLRDDGQPIKTTMTYENGKITNWEFSYLDNFIVKKSVFINGVLKAQHHIKYDFN